MTGIQIITKQFILCSRLYKNVLEGINDEKSVVRLSDHVNHLRWIAGHLLMIRYRNIVRLGLESEVYPHADKFIIPDMPPPNARPIDSTIEYPTLKESLSYWDLYSEYTLKALPALTEEQLNTEGTFESPIGGKTLLDTLAFIATHEVYHIGQMGLIRKTLGYKAMSYN